jgi:hypothetical protein
MRIRVLALVVGLAACGSSDVTRSVGARCDVTADCDDRCLVPSNEFPDGLCTLDCTTDSDCPSNAVCVDREGGVCLFTCTDNTDCEFLGTGWRCMEDASRQNTDVKVMVCRGD